MESWAAHGRGWVTFECSHSGRLSLQLALMLRHPDLQIPHAVLVPYLFRMWGALGFLISEIDDSSRRHCICLLISNGSWSPRLPPSRNASTSPRCALCMHAFLSDPSTSLICHLSDATRRPIPADGGHKLMMSFFFSGKGQAAAI